MRTVLAFVVILMMGCSTSPYMEHARACGCDSDIRCNNISQYVVCECKTGFKCKICNGG